VRDDPEMQTLEPMFVTLYPFREGKGMPFGRKGIPASFSRREKDAVLRKRVYCILFGKEIRILF